MYTLSNAIKETEIIKETVRWACKSDLFAHGVTLSIGACNVYWSVVTLSIGACNVVHTACYVVHWSV